MSASWAMPDDQKAIELALLVTEHTTDCEATVIDGRLYVTWTDQRPEGLVAVAKNVFPAEALDRIIDRLMMAREMRNAVSRRVRGN